MSLHRFFCEKIVEPVTELAGIEARHLSRVLRLVREQQVELFDGKGILSKATIKKVSSKKVLLQINETTIFNPRTNNKIILAASVAKGDRFDWLLEKCTELGADRITPVIFDRTVKLAANPKVVRRWMNIVISAAKQSRRIFLPLIDRPLLLPEAFEMLRKQYPEAVIVFGSLEEQDKSILSVYNGIGDVIAFVGPEGGLTDSEIVSLKSNSSDGIRLTETVLRTETAAVSICAILATLRDSEKKYKNF